MFWAEIWKKYQNFYLKIFIILVVKISVYLDRHVFVMLSPFSTCNYKVQVPRRNWVTLISWNFKVLISPWLKLTINTPHWKYTTKSKPVYDQNVRSDLCRDFPVSGILLNDNLFVGFQDDSEMAGCTWRLMKTFKLLLADAKCWAQFASIPHTLLEYSSRKHADIILTPLNPTFIW